MLFVNLFSALGGIFLKREYESVSKEEFEGKTLVFWEGFHISGQLSIIYILSILFCI